MRLRGLLAGSAMTAALALTACGGGSGNTSSGGASGGQPTMITITTDTGAEPKFNPATYEAPANSPVKIVFKNISTIQPHNLVFQSGLTVKGADSVAPGQSETLDVTTPGPGSYKFVCTLHPGMEGTLNVK